MFNKTLNFNRKRDLTSINNQLPNLSDTLTGWEIQLYMEKVIQLVENGDVVIKTIPFNLTGVFQPLKAEDLQLKPEGQRSWSWWLLHTKSNSNVHLHTQDIIIYMDKKYKVMAVKDYSLYGYIEYEMIEDYEGKQ